MCPDDHCLFARSCKGLHAAVDFPVGLRRRRFGRVRQVESGRWQARYSTPDGREHTGAQTFGTKTEASRLLPHVEPTSTVAYGSIILSAQYRYANGRSDTWQRRRT